MDTVKFIASYIANPAAVGSLLPSSSWLAREIAAATKEFDPKTLLLEFGAGSGAVTKYLPSYSGSLEIAKNFVELLKLKFPDREIYECDVIQTLFEIKEPVNIVSSIPLINNSYAQKFKEALKRANSLGLIENAITYSYGHNSPSSNCGFRNDERLKRVFFNVPPASIWKYW